MDADVESREGAFFRSEGAYILLLCYITLSPLLTQILASINYFRYFNGLRWARLPFWSRFALTILYVLPVLWQQRAFWSTLQRMTQWVALLKSLSLCVLAPCARAGRLLLQLEFNSHTSLSRPRRNERGNMPQTLKKMEPTLRFPLPGPEGSLTLYLDSRYSA